MYQEIILDYFVIDCDILTFNNAVIFVSPLNKKKNQIRNYGRFPDQLLEIALLDQTWLKSKWYVSTHNVNIYSIGL